MYVVTCTLVAEGKSLTDFFSFIVIYELTGGDSTCPTMFSSSTNLEKKILHKKPPTLKYKSK